MTNMMNGAVAIYGGVGVMEIRQPLPQTVESMAQAVEGLAVNAHISLRELKNTVAAVIEKKLPKYAQLMEMHPVIAARTVVGGATLTAYENGYAVYEEDGAHTVMAIDRCGDYRYDFNDGTYEVVPAAVFEDAEWSVRLVMEGERRMESNRSKTVAINEAASLDCDGSDWSDAVMVDFLDEENAEMLAEEELRKLYAAMGKLTERQQEIIQLYFYKGLNQYEIAEELGIARPVVSKIMAGGKTSDAEILDARVDADGNTHENLGAHIRSGFESARADQEEAVNHIGRMAAVSDAMRTANMVHTVDFGASNTSGDVKATAVSLGHGDRAGVIINGALKEGENDVSVLRFTEPMAFKAGTPYTVFIDETTPKVGYGIYFYEVGTGNCLQVGGINRGFTPANTKIATAVFDNGGMFRAGIYSTNCEFENHELHLYVVEGEYTQRDFFGLSTVADVSGNVAEIASVRDEVRKNNLIVMKQVILKNEENEPLWTSTPVGALNLGATVLNGQLGPTAGTYAVQISSPFMLDKEKDYTLFLLDERKDLEYSVYLLDETTWKDVMENGATRAFNVIHSPCGLIPAHQTGKHQLRIWVQQDTVFDNRAIQVYLVEGRYSESELRTYLPAKEASAATKGLIGNLNALNRISDPLRRNNMIRTIDFQASASDGQVCATAVSSGVASGTVINGSLGPKQGRNTLYFGESIWLDRTKKYTLYVRSDESMPSCEVYLYGNSKSGCMQVDGLNKGFSVHGIIPVTFTPDESGYYRPGIYTSQDLNFPNCEMHLFVLEGVYAYDTVRGLVEFNDLNGSFTSLAAVHDNVRSKNLFRTINYGDSNPQTNAKIQMIADSDIDQASVKIVGNMGGTLALNSIRCTTLVPLTSGKTYTLLVREDEDCPALTVFLGDEVTYGSIQINGATVSVNTKNRHVYTFTADKDYSCRARVVCDTATTFDGQHIRVYLVEGAYTEQQMRSWAEYSELLQVKVDADQRVQVLSDREDARWISTHNGLENILTVSDRARMNNMVKTIDSVVRSNAGDVSATATALGVLDGAGIIVNGLMSSELNATILRISEPMHLEKGKAYTVHIVDDDPPAPYSMFFYRTTSSACLQQGGTNRGVSAIGGRFEQVIPDTTGDYQMGIYATGAVFSNHLIHAYMYEGQDWSADDFYAYPKSDTLAAVISEMAAVKDDVRKKNLVRMLGNKGFLDGTGVYRLNSIGMPDPAGIMLNGTFGTASTTTYTNISEVFHLEAGQSYTILVRDTDKTVDYNMTLVDKTTGAAVKQNGMGLAFNVQKSPFGTFAPDASMDVRLRINYRKEMTLEDHMPRPKGSKNKPKTVKTTVDFAAQIAEKQSAKEATTAEIASITANIDALKADLKTKKAELKSIDKELARIEAKKVKAETKAAESAKKAEAEDVLKKLLASGVSADDILAKLK